MKVSPDVVLARTEELLVELKSLKQTEITEAEILGKITNQHFLLWKMFVF